MSFKNILKPDILVQKSTVTKAGANGKTHSTSEPPKQSNRGHGAQGVPTSLSQINLEVRHSRFGMADFTRKHDATSGKSGTAGCAGSTGQSTKQVLPYFMELVLSNQVRTKESERAIAQAEIKRRTEAIKLAELAAREEELRLRELETEESESLSITPEAAGTDQNIDEIDEHRQFRRAPKVLQPKDEGSDSSEHEDDKEEDGAVRRGDRGLNTKVTLGAKRLKTVATRKFYLKEVNNRRGGEAQIGKEVDSITHRRFSRTVWRHAMNNMEPEYRLPALILKKHLYVKNEEPTRLGPGTYDPSYDLAQDKKRNALTKGQMKSCSHRFTNEKEVGDIPGPGTYGIPHEAWEKANEKYKHPGKVSLFMSGPCVRKDLNQGKGSGLPPGYYNVKDGMTEMLNKVTSLRGPYDLYTPERLNIPYGYHKTLKLNPLGGPGQYNVRRTLKQEIHSRANRYKGIFSPYPRERKITGERIALVSPLWPVNAGDMPGPGQYDTDSFKATLRKNKYGFGSSIENVRPQFDGDYDMAPGKYTPEKGRKYCPLGCGHKSAFKSKTGRLSPRKFAVLTERLRPKDIPQEERIAFNTR